MTILVMLSTYNLKIVILSLIIVYVISLVNQIILNEINNRNTLSTPDFNEEFIGVNEKV